MKNIAYTFLFCCTLVLFSCSDYDNYEGPQETLTGTIIDKTTGKGLQTEVGDNGVRLKMLEYSWSDNPTPYYFTCMQDGKFNNTKIFEGEYNIEPIGAFVPLYQIDQSGNTLVDKRVQTTIKGTKELNFEVEPFLKVDWIGDPVLNADSTITVQVKITRGTTNPNYQHDIEDIRLFINSSSYYVGDNNYDNRYSSDKITGSSAQEAIGEIITLTTKKDNGVGFSPNRDYYIRVGARINHTIDGVKRYNYNEPLKVNVLSQ